MSLASDNIPPTATQRFQRNARLNVATGGATGTLVANTPVVVPGTVEASHLKGFVYNASLKTLTYIGAEKRDFRVAIDFLISHAHSSARTLRVNVEVNGVVASWRGLSVANGSTARLALQDLLTLKRGDVVRVTVQQTDTEAVTVAASSKLLISA
jgi:hypothetical protein